MQMDTKWMEGGAKSCNIMMMDCSDAKLYKTGNHQQYLSFLVIVDVLCCVSYTASPLVMASVTSLTLSCRCWLGQIILGYITMACATMCQSHTKLASNFKC